MHRGERGGALGQLAWDDLKFFLVCAESGSFRKAGKLLRVELGDDCQKDWSPRSRRRNETFQSQHRWRDVDR